MTWRPGSNHISGCTSLLSVVHWGCLWVTQRGGVLLRRGCAVRSGFVAFLGHMVGGDKAVVTNSFLPEKVLPKLEVILHEVFAVAQIVVDLLTVVAGVSTCMISSGMVA